MACMGKTLKTHWNDHVGEGRRVNQTQCFYIMIYLLFLYVLLNDWMSVLSVLIIWFLSILSNEVKWVWGKANLKSALYSSGHWNVEGLQEAGSPYNTQTFVICLVILGQKLQSSINVVNFQIKPDTLGLLCVYIFFTEPVTNVLLNVCLNTFKNIQIKNLLHLTKILDFFRVHFPNSIINI